VAEARKRRDAGAAAALDRLGSAARGDEALMPVIVEAVRARATLGEISDTLRDAWGEYRP
jgi:methylmalonyl-CoA mutase N-terminal domain/subunit